jgi:PQQ-dependent dehydrogenase (methanol/ethanol family)
MRKFVLASIAFAFTAVSAFAQTAPGPPVTPVDHNRIVNADKEPGNWLSHGRTYSEQRYSPLEQITADNVSKLGLAWFADIPVQRGMEATPIVVDGRLYMTSAWSVVYAFDAKTGQALWTYDPKVPLEWGKNACCDVVNRGVAAWGSKIYVGTIDGRLVALDAATGKPVWDINTIDRDWPYTITGAPRVVKGKVIIGNGGAELGVRGYVTAYDAETGAQLWRFHTVPGDPAKGFENKAMEAAAKTWNGEWWKYGGGGTVWDSMAYDADLDQLYIGVGNGSPWNRKIRSPNGGDNLYLSSIVALKADTGEYIWHYQTTPGDTWDFTATQHIMLIDITVDGTPRKALVQAPKNGFFYVIDRTNGKLLSGNAYVPMNWAKGLDEAGRPIEMPEARYPDPAKPQLIFPSPFGGHNWHPMAYSPKTNLVYLPAQEMPFVFKEDTAFTFKRGWWNLGTEFKYASLPEDPKEIAKILPLLKGRLLAWDPVTNKEKFRIEHAGPWSGGVLATAGNLIFQGTPGGEFTAYRADNGDKLWSMAAQTGVVAGPVSYSVGGEQYVAITVGWGTAFGLVVSTPTKPRSRILVFKLGADGKLPALKEDASLWPAKLLPVTGNAEVIDKGKDAYLTRCFMCHGDAALGGGVLPDLRFVSEDKHAIWNSIVLEGAFSVKGMPAFDGVLAKDQVEAIQQYVLSRAHATKP